MLSNISLASLLLSVIEITVSKVRKPILKHIILHVEKA